MRGARVIRRVLPVLAVLVVGWLGYGPLFAWSPWTPGFQTGRTPHMTIRFRDPPGRRHR
jgi:hypothetical protein